MKRGKKYVEAAKAVDRATLYDTAEAISLVKKAAVAKFDETIEVHIRTGCDGRHADQQIRGAVVLPHGTGKKVRVLVFAKDAKAEEAKAAGADYVGAEDLIPRIQNEGWLDFDVVVATPDMMGVVGRLGRVLGPKGLMPNPKAGTVTMDVTKAINDIKAGKIEYRLDKTNIIHIVTDALHNPPHACRSDLKMVLFFVCFIIKIYKLICKPGTWIQRNTNPFCHTVCRHIFQNFNLICDPAGIMINLLSLYRKAYSTWQPLKKLHSKSILQRLDNLAHTRLRRIKNLRCITERTRLCTYYKIL